MRHGCLLASVAPVVWPLAIAIGGPVGDEPLLTAQSRQFDIAYAVNPDAEPLDSVTLYYTMDDGLSWERFGVDPDRVSPISFTAPREGLCGLYFVIANAAGDSGPPPESGTVPQMWVLIDYTLPVVQLHEPRVERRADATVVIQVRWTALDARLASRPIDLAYRVLPDGEWQDARTRLSNAGRFDWRVPDDVTGSIVLRLTVRDQAGHAATAESSPIDLSEPVRAEQPEEAKALPLEEERPAPTVTPEDRERARELLRKGRYHQLRGEHDLAVARLQDAVKLDPQQSDALVSLGASLYALGRYDEAAEAFESLLKELPHDRSGLEGLARALVAMKHYDAAEAKLFTIIERDPDDVETWLHLGDVAIYRGDEIDAREYYRKAATLQPDATSTIEKAEARLDDLAGMTRYHREHATP